MNGELRLPVLEHDGDLSGFVGGIDLEEAGVGGERVEDINGLAAQIVAADAAEDDGMVAQAARHHRKVGGRAAQLRALRATGPTAVRLRPKSDAVLSSSCSVGRRIVVRPACHVTAFSLEGQSSNPRGGGGQADPAVEGAILIIGRGVDAVRLVGEDAVVGDGVGARALDLAGKKARKTRLGGLAPPPARC